MPVGLELGMGRGWRTSEVHVRKSRDYLGESAGSNVSVPGDSAELPVGRRNMLLVTGGKVKGDPC